MASVVLRTIRADLDIARAKKRMFLRKLGDSYDIKTTVKGRAGNWLDQRFGNRPSERHDRDGTISGGSATSRFIAEAKRRIAGNLCVNTGQGSGGGFVNCLGQEQSPEIFPNLKLSKEQLVRLGGAVNGMNVRFGPGDAEDIPNLIAFGNNSKFSTDYHFRNGKPDHVYMDHWQVGDGAPNGTGTKALLTLAEEAKRQGFKYISLYAAGELSDERYSGYYTWARLGFDGRTESGVSRSLWARDTSPDQPSRELMELFAGYKHVSQYMATPEGREFWRRYGYGFHGELSLSDDSPGLKTLREYARAKNIVTEMITEAKKKIAGNLCVNTGQGSGGGFTNCGGAGVLSHGAGLAREGKISEVSPEKFKAALTKNARADTLSDYSLDDLGTMKLFMLDGHDAGYAIKGGDELVNLFNNGGAGSKGAGPWLVLHAVRNGARRGDHFDGFLTDFYRSLGFAEERREKNWNPGGPDVVYIKWAGGNPDVASTVYRQTGRVVPSGIRLAQSSRAESRRGAGQGDSSGLVKELQTASPERYSDRLWVRRGLIAEAKKKLAGNLCVNVGQGSGGGFVPCSGEFGGGDRSIIADLGFPSRSSRPTGDNDTLENWREYYKKFPEPLRTDLLKSADWAAIVHDNQSFSDALDCFAGTFCQEELIASMLDGSIDQKPAVKKTLKDFTAAIASAPTTTNVVYRGTDAFPEIESALESFGNGGEGTLEFKTFTSTSLSARIATQFTQEKMAGNNRGLMFEIHGKSGRLFAAASNYRHEYEVVFLPGTRFKIKRVEAGVDVNLGGPVDRVILVTLEEI